jgi:hypothetical protein
MDWVSFLIGMAAMSAIWTIYWPAKVEPAPKVKPAPKVRRLRREGDLLMHSGCGLPVLLIEQLTYDKFRGCFITPEAKAFGAVVGKKDTPCPEMTDIIIFEAHDRERWPDYPHELADKESANFAAAMLKGDQ